jgi:serine protease AprX
VRSTTRTIKVAAGLATVLTALFVGMASASAATTTSATSTLGYDPATDTGSLDAITKLVGARDMWSKGYTGKGIDVALIDTGVATVPGLNSGNVVNGPDLSTDSQSSALRYRDSYGHGTHMASIIAGRDTASTPAGYAASTTATNYTGVAPDARVISLKVAATDGSADVSQVIAAVNWVTQHAHDPGLNIRILNLSYGTPAGQSYLVDPLTYAVEAAWRAGIVVVVSAGNDGTSHTDLDNPAQDPNVIAVGAEDPNGTMTTTDDTIPAFSDRGTSKRHVDVVAPGTHVLGLRVSGSEVSDANPAGLVGTRFIRGSGTSQAAAVTSGAIALLLQARPDLNPDQVRWVITNSATLLLKGTLNNRGAGMVNADAALTVANTGIVPSVTVLTLKTVYGTGTGSLELARGGSHVYASTSAGSATVELTGEKDIFGTSWNPITWAPATLSKATWTGGNWRGNAWTGTTFGGGGNWTSVNWSASSWYGGNWASGTWTGRTWVANSWSGRTWVSSSWSGRTWADQSWSSSAWS